ncbi:MAG: hypothetical protein AAGC93_07225 [Cyanobacteria bacterium P01_F01_bin.53]
MDNAGTVDVPNATASASSISLRDRFQGALLGLWLSPTAMALSLSNESPGLPDHSVPDISVDISRLAYSTLPLSFELMRAFSLESNRFDQYLSSVVGCGDGDDCDGDDAGQCHLPCWLACVPALLRYHDSQSRRLKWLALHQPHLELLAVRNRVAWAVAHEQILILGDFMEIVLGRMALGIKAAPLLNYFTELRMQRVVESNDYMAAVDSIGYSPADFTDVLWHAVECPGGYAAAMQGAFERAVSSHRQQGLYRQAWDDVLLTGFAAGMLYGAGALPVSWQVAGFSHQFGSNQVGLIHSGISRPEVVDIAGRLFERWVGIRTSV